MHTFDYHEKAEVFKYYPQYYHKTDKVWANPHHTTSALYFSMPTHPC